MQVLMSQKVKRKFHFHLHVEIMTKSYFKPKERMNMHMFFIFYFVPDLVNLCASTQITVLPCWQLICFDSRYSQRHDFMHGFYSFSFQNKKDKWSIREHRKGFSNCHHAVWWCTAHFSHQAVLLIALEWKDAKLTFYFERYWAQFYQTYLKCGA